MIMDDIEKSYNCNKVKLGKKLFFNQFIYLIYYQVKIN